MRRSLAALAAASLFALTACGGSDDPATDASPSAEATTEAAADETTEAPAGSQQEIAVDEAIKDDVMGHAIKVTGLVRDFAAPDHTNIPEGGGEWVLVEVDVTAGKKYSGGVQGGFKLTSAGQLAGSATGLIDDAMTSAGFTPWETASAGEHTTGWIAFQVNTRSGAYQLEYKRGAASVIGGGDPIAEKIWTIDLPIA